jgi:hypothetical protein
LTVKNKSEFLLWPFEDWHDIFYQVLPYSTLLVRHQGHIHIHIA